MSLAAAPGGWSVVSSPNPDSWDDLLNVTCWSSSDCWAVGFDNPTIPYNYQALIEQWSGTSWVTVDAPDTSANQSNYLLSVTCASASDCWAVGNYSPTGLYGQTLVEQWNGEANKAAMVVAVNFIAVLPKIPSPKSWGKLHSPACPQGCTATCSR